MFDTGTSQQVAQLHDDDKSQITTIQKSVCRHPTL